MGSARTDQDYEWRVKKERHKQFILVHPSSRATSSLLCTSTKESSTKSINCSLTINQTIPNPCKNQLLPVAPNQFSKHTRLTPIALVEKRPSSSVLEPMLTQETLIQTSVEELTSRSSPQRRWRPDNRHHDFTGTCKHKKHHVSFDHNRRGDSITMTVIAIIDVVFVFFFKIYRINKLVTSLHKFQKPAISIHKMIWNYSSYLVHTLIYTKMYNITIRTNSNLY